eukprot:CAMPEP_0172313466 /NCGR_PEP_ID=MMETSP1058-20130122/20225_1 /TAXON_ID=83371 /ORGANISM="Detonula confervacea, Strain CCMP 353" /LENGTH=482 /DNA_ID=CAMNT_0013027115 /DNA_START=174 /DNA_END=1622 /DNA_ORIENTATION=-
MSQHDNDTTATAPPSTLSISSRTLQTLDPCVILMKQIISQHASKWENDPQGIFSLAQGVVHWRPPNSAYEALSRAVQENMEPQNISNSGGTSYGMDGAIGGGDGRLIHTYCPDEGYPPLLTALKDKLQTENGLQNPHVMVTSGANQAYVNCVLTLLDERDEMGNISKCVVFEPYYFNHVMAVQSTRGGGLCGGNAAASAAATDAKSVEGLLVGPTTEGVPDLAWLRSQLEDHKYGNDDAGNAIRMVTLVNPGNPTGVSLPHAFLEEITQLTKEYGVWLVMDNTYEHFDVEKKNKLSDEEKDNDTFACFDEEHVINIFSFSKGFAMAGFRVGYIALSSKNGETGRGTNAYEEMLKIQDTIAICTSRISQMAALGALQAGREWVYEQVKTLGTGRAAILEAMSSLEEIIGGNGAMYLMGKLPDGVDDQEFASLLVEHYGVAVIPGSFCGLPGWIRVCYSNLPPEDCKIAASRLKKGILELAATK